MRNQLRSAAAWIVLAGAGITGTAKANDVFTFENYPDGPVVGRVDPTSGAMWVYQSATETANAVVVSDRGSASVKSLKLPANASGPAGRLGIALTQPATPGTGVWRLQYDFYMTPQTAGSNVPARVAFLNTVSTPGDPGTQVFQTNFFNAAPNAVAGVFSSQANPTNTGLVYAETFQTDYYGDARARPDGWYRVVYYFDFSNAQYPGRLLYAEMYDLGCPGTALIGDRRPDFAPTLIPASGQAAEFRTLQIRFGGGTQDAWLDNIRFESIGSYTVPADPRPPATARPPARAPVTLDLRQEFDFFGVPIGEMPSMSLVNGTLYTLDSLNGLTSWSGSGPQSDSVDLSPPIAFGGVPTGVMAHSADRTKLYVFADSTDSGDVDDDPVFPWRDLNIFDIATHVWTYRSADNLFGHFANVGDHSTTVVTVNGQERVYVAWTGAAYYTAFNPDGTRGPDLTGVGNRWAGASTEAFGDDATGSSFFYLRQTDASGNPLNNNSQQYQAIERVAYGGGCRNDSLLGRRVSPSKQVLPWVTDATDGPDVNRHAMEYVPATNCIWVLRAGAAPGSNQLGVYDIDTDTWGVANMMRDGQPFRVQAADIQLMGDRMFIMSEGTTAVYSMDARIDGAPTCRVDIDGNGTVNVQDFLGFLQLFASGDARADFDASGGVNIQDFLAFLQAFAAGC
jgi:hypothetical protein